MSNYQQIKDKLDEWFEVEFTFTKTEPVAELIAAMSAAEQSFVLGWSLRVSAVNVELAYQFALNSRSAMDQLELEFVEAWALMAMDAYDRTGLRPALQIIRNVDQFVRQSFEQSAGSLFERCAGVLLPFARGLSGRELKLDETVSLAYTDTETLFVPAIVARLNQPESNFLLHKAMLVQLWAQTRFGSFRHDILRRLLKVKDIDCLLPVYLSLETIRHDHRIAVEFPGLARDMKWLRQQLGEDVLYQQYSDRFPQLKAAEASALDSVDLLAELSANDVLVCCYRGAVNLDSVVEVASARIERERATLKVRLAELTDELLEAGKIKQKPERFDVQAQDNEDTMELADFELIIDEQSLSVPENISQLLTSITLDFTDIPDEYLVPAGDGEFDLSIYEEEELDPNDVWVGVYHEEGAHIYPEWDYKRLTHRKNWCVMRELDVPPVYDDFYQNTMNKYDRLIKSLHRTFEALRGEDKLLKKQQWGDDIDIDAVTEALADAHSGMEMSDRLFQHMKKEDRNIAVLFMVDMSGSTKGWINQAERESLILLSESLETLGDRYAIYGFSGVGRKRCELYRVKQFEDAYNDEVIARISGMEAQDYTRMGVAIRHLSHVLNTEVDAKIKLLITLSDGKPEDYDGYYRSEYGIEDTRQALFEARRSGIHPFCITIDDTAQDYLPHLYGAANYVVIDDVEKLPVKVSDIYRKLTT